MMSGGGVFRLQGVLRCLEVEYSGYRGVLLGCLEWNGCPTRMFGVFRQNILLSYIFSYMHQMDVEILNSDLAHTQLQCASIELHFSSENLLEANQILTHYRGESNSPPDFTISVYSSSCNLLFFGSTVISILFFLYQFLGIPFCLGGCY